MKGALFSLAASTVLLGCAPLEQAPLLYTSTVTVGASTGVNTTETPGFDFTFGYKQTDAAYVPVAVSKNGSPDDPNSASIYNIQLIQATKADLTKSEEATNSSHLDNLEKSKKKLDAYEANYKALVNLKDQLNSEMASNSGLIRDLMEEKSRVQQSSELNSEEKAKKIDGIQESLNLAGSSKSQLDIKYSKILDDIAASEANLKDASKEYTVLRAEIESQDGSQGDGSKFDAYSVYGSFDSKTGAFGGAKPGSENALGKVFSTGVAAQTLAEAEKEKARMAGTTNCLKNVEALAKELADDSVITRDIILACKPVNEKF